MPRVGSRSLGENPGLARTSSTTRHLDAASQPGLFLFQILGRLTEIDGSKDLYGNRAVQNVCWWPAC